MATENGIPEFKSGEMVELQSDPSKKGAITKIILGSPENRYKVFIEGGIQTFYASQLQSTVTEKDAEPLVSLDDFYAHLCALQINNPGRSTLYSLNSAKIDYIPYQFRPVLRFIRSDRPRLLIADSVGVGKTIEAGLILQELKARTELESVLIICPRPLVTEKKWQREMERFGEKFQHLNGKQLQLCINETNSDGEWPSNYGRAILPISLLRDETLEGKPPTNRGNQKIGLKQLDPPPHFDLVIVDEAHHIRNTGSQRHQAVKYFCEHADAVIFLTATPIQLGNKDLLVLLNILRPDLIIDKASFDHVSEPNAAINRAIEFTRTKNQHWQNDTLEAILEAEHTGWGQSMLKRDPDFIQVKERLEGAALTDEERVRLIRSLEELHTFSSIINRTRRRDIANFTIRRPHTIEIEFTTSQEAFYKELLEVQAEIYQRLHGDMSVQFLMTTIRRQASSCLHGLAPLLHDLLNRHIDELLWTETGDAEDFEEFEKLKKAPSQIKTQINGLIEQAKKLDKADPKYDKLCEVVQTKKETSNHRLMLFSSFRHTLGYLNKRLLKDGFRVGMIHGGVKDEERRRLRTRFELPKNDNEGLDILLFSEVGSEGLDYQFCDAMVNYDLPWNPMRIEQRIGRIDRWGQKSEYVSIYNLIVKGTIDATIYERCLKRIGIFERELGGNEAILSELVDGIKKIGQDFSLTALEQEEKLQQLADNKIRTEQEIEALAEKEDEFLGIQVSQDQMEADIDDARNFWISPDVLAQLIVQYIRRRTGKDQTFVTGNGKTKTLRLSKEDRVLLLTDFTSLGIKRNITSWKQWLKGTEQNLSITFDSQTASDEPEAEFISLSHPLVKQAAQTFNTDERIFVSLIVSDSELPAGEYPFILYRWNWAGLHQDSQSKTISVNEEVTQLLPQLLTKAAWDAAGQGEEQLAPSWEKIEGFHYELWQRELDEHKASTQKSVGFKLESLEKSTKKRITVAEEQITKAGNKNITVMRKQQVENIQAEHERNVAKLEAAGRRADITFKAVVFGTIKIEREN